MSAGQDYSFRCTACGKCCDSAPEMSLPELLHHEQRFLGRLGIRRLSSREVLLFTLAWTDERASRCPALEPDGRCAIHDDRKPAACAIVPLDARLPDAAQADVLADRAREAAYLGADCIVAGAREGYAPLVRRLQVVAPAAQTALAGRRRELALEAGLWRNEVQRLLGPDLLSKPEELERIPLGGFLSLSIAPVLMVVAAVSARSSARIVQYLDAQRALAMALGLSKESQTCAAVRDALARQPRSPETPRTIATETWLGLDDSPCHSAKKLHELRHA